ncbi:hypothetical protein OE88DRAFT_1739577 [Heliocybe sulcata]|uniref:Uncharacterized protein n=1 Tax=Heliocybe sulcata TaxID=5364 RepID=A0A5C3MXU5_9AGAM|nr:hypothetical protein OE88DRAFT_1739577 [Heliocybe sulcata]
MLREVLKRQNKMEKEIQTLRKQVASNQTIAASTASQSHADNTRRARCQIREHEKRLEARKDKNTSGADDEEADNEGSKDELDDQHWDELLKAPEHLSPPLRSAKALLNHLEISAFRMLCGVGVKEKWPEVGELRINEKTNQPYFTPDFDQWAAEQLPNDLRHSSVHFNRKTIEWMAKETFRGFKAQAARERDEVKMAKQLENESNTRRHNRRTTKLKHLRLGAKLYAKLHGVDPMPLLENIDIVSDYASGPEDEDKESKADWKRMNSLTWGVEFEWLLEDIMGLYLNSLLERDLSRFGPKRFHASTRWNERPPIHVPWDFTIQRGYYEEFQDSWEFLMQQWYTRGDPEGFGKNTPQPEDETSG